MDLYSLYLQCGEITTDSRHCPVGSIFLALRGANFDGNEYAASALDKGCAYAIVDRADVAKDGRYIVVDDCLAAYKDIARRHRLAFHGPVIGITGTNGKTTTKELVAAVLAKKYKVMYTEGNLNNEIGVPRTLLRLNDGYDIAVVEMGASHPGDIASLAAVALPSIGLITNVGKAHIAGFGSLDGVLHTKGELYDQLRRNARPQAFIDAGNDLLMSIAGGLDLIKYAADESRTDASVTGRVVSCTPALTFEWSADGETHTVETRLIGAYNITNMLAAATVGRHFGVAAADICAALSEYTPGNSRSQWVQTAANSLIVDTYNANPTSMRAAIDNFRQVKAAKKMAILGGMSELGPISVAEHREIISLLKAAQFDEVWTVGSEFAEGIDSPYPHFASVAEVKAEIARRKPEGYCILIKGSNSKRLFEIPELL